jgi:hypothetical protein
MPAQQQYQYQSSLSNLASEECRALEAVIQDRQRYGIVARSEAQDEATLQQCIATGETSLRQNQAGPPMQGVEEVQLVDRR